MLYHLFYALTPTLSAFNLFKYLTFRTFGATFTALILSLSFGHQFIKWLKSQQKDGQPIREDGPPSHLITKKGTPTMGGLLILMTAVASTLLWCDLNNAYIWLVLFVTITFGALGAIDDYLKLIRAHVRGVPARVKLLIQGTIAILAVFWFISITPSPSATMLMFPFFKHLVVELNWFFIPFAAFVMVGASNAVNLTDGLDGLAIVPVMLTAGCFMIISYLVGNHIFANYLHLHFIAGSGEIAVLCGALVGAGLGFLWFNAPPASVFMGDTGSLALGGTLGAISVITKHEIVLMIIGGLFVIETASVMIQVFYYKRTKRRIFLMAPIHHHFEKKGWAEQTIVIRFWIISVILALIGLSTLKLR